MTQPIRLCADPPGGRHTPAAADGPRRGLDTVTGLPERSEFIRRAGALQARGVPVTLVAMDLERFTEFNECYGLAAGDALLREVALRCARVLQGHGEMAVLGRVGCDEFALAVPAVAGFGGPVQPVVAALRQAMAQPLQWPGVVGYRPRLAIGQATLPPEGDAAESLLHAVAARRQSVHGGVAVHCHESQREDRRLTQALREAIVADRIDIALQPKLRLADQRVVGLEALARWTLDDGSIVPPARFIPLAERHGLIPALGERVLERALATLSRWRAQGLPLVPVAVNVSATQFHEGDIAAHVAQALARHDLPASLLELELTESMLLVDAEAALRTLHGLRRLGVCLSIDDFGTGWSSLAYLLRFPVHHLKIDRSFVQGITQDSGARDIVQLLVQLAQRLKLQCVAEGVETPEQHELLRAMGCDQGQGYLWGRPVPAAEIEPFLRCHAAASAPPPQEYAA